MLMAKIPSLTFLLNLRIIWELERHTHKFEKENTTGRNHSFLVIVNDLFLFLFAYLFAQIMEPYGIIQTIYKMA